MADLVYTADVDISAALKKMKALNAEMAKFEANGKETFNSVSRSGSQRFRQLGFALQRFGIGGAAAFGEIFVAAGAVGIAIGGVLVAVKALVTAFKALASVALDVMQKIIDAGIEAAKQYEVAEAQFTAIFKGGRKEALATLEVVKRVSRELGENVTDIARTFLPEVGSLDQLEKVVELAVALSRAQPEQGIFGARVALQDALSGEFRSLQRRFEFTPTAIEGIRDAFENAGIEGLLTAIEAELERTGRSVEDLSDTFGVALGRVQETARQTAGVLGEPILDELKTQLEGLFSFMESRGDELKGLAAGAGQAFAEIVKSIGGDVQEFLEGLDFQDVLDIVNNVADALQRVAERLGDLLNKLDIGKVAEFSDKLNAWVRDIDITITILGDLYGIFKTVFDFLGLLQGRFKLNTDETGFFRKGVEALAKVLAVVHGALDAMVAGLSNLGNIMKVVRGEMSLTELAVSAQTDMWAAMKEQVDEVNEVLRENEHISIDTAAATEEVTEADEEAANAMRAREKALRDLDDAQKKMAEAEAKIAEKREAFQTEAAKKFAKIDETWHRARLDATIDNARRLLDIEEKHLEKMDDLREDYNQKLRDLFTDEERDQEDIMREHGRKVIKLEREIGEERRDLERDHLLRLAEIRRRFDFDAEEAIRANDAIAYLRIRRRMEFELNEERIRYENSLEEAEHNANRRREVLNEALEQEIEDAQIANRRKIDDLNTWLSDQTTTINTWEKRARDESLKRLERDRQDAQEARRRQNEDYIKWWNEKHDITEKEIAEEVALYEEMAARISEIMSSIQLGASSIVRYGSAAGRGGFARRGESGGSRGGGGNVPDQTMDQLRATAIQLWIRAGRDRNELIEFFKTATAADIQKVIRELQSELGLNQTGRKEGGPVIGGKSVLVGEPLAGNKPNPELFIPPSDGFIVPVAKMARKAGKSPTEMLSMIRKMKPDDMMNFVDVMRQNLGIDGRQMGGPVRQGEAVFVGEPLPNGEPNPEMFIPVGAGEALEKVIGRAGGFLPTIIEQGAKPGGSEIARKSISKMTTLHRRDAQRKLSEQELRLLYSGAQQQYLIPGRGQGERRRFFSPRLDRGRPTDRERRQLKDRRYQHYSAASQIYERDQLLTMSGDDKSPSIEYGDMLSHLVYNPAYASDQGGSVTSIDNSRSVVVKNPQVDPGLTDKQISEVKELYTRLRIEEGLME